MKKILIIIMSLLMVFFCFGCNGVYDPIINPNKRPDDLSDPDKDPDAPVQTESFKVTLECNGVPCYPKYVPGNPAKARWTSFDGLSVYEAEFDDGVAEANLDGDYYVTIWNIDEAFDTPYTYDANSYTADNDNRHTTIQLFKILDTTHSTGSHIYNNIKTVTEGTYRAVIDSEWNGNYIASIEGKYEGIVFYQYQPRRAGHYSVQSLVDLTDNEVNPILEYYTGSSQFKLWDRRIDTGGKSSTYSKNFRFDVTIRADEIGNVWGFGIRAENRSKQFPITIDFSIKYEGALSDQEAGVGDKYEKIIAEGPFQDPSIVSAEAAKGRFVYNYKDDGMNGLCDGSRFEIDSKDGFYHLYDPEKYAENDGYGPILFAKLTQDCEVALSESNNKGFFCEAGIYLVQSIRVESGNKNYLSFINAYQPLCDNTYGLHAVNEELKQFLQDFADSNDYFADGRGKAEINGMFSAEDNFWLFACGYFKY